ncbi:MAG: DUF2344 domain-containing protein [Oscillospiraceae bacterium]|nr:DUF2344 domain-containing protein [Oscillospiraceae bacterium]
MNKIRVQFTKVGRVSYMSHLDLNRFMQRALRRSNLPIKYTEGFNPHAYLTFALPLSLGFESKVETMDFKLTEDISPEIVKDRLNAVLPDGLKVVSAAPPVHSNTDIIASEYTVRIKSKSLNSSELESKFDVFYSQDELIAEKFNKKKKQIFVDIKPVFEIMTKYEINDEFVLKIKAPSGNEKNYNPNLLVDMFIKHAEISDETVKIERNRIICSDNSDFL